MINEKVMQKAFDLHKQGLWQQSIDVFESDFKLFKEDKDALVTLGICYLRLGEYDKALATFESIPSPFPPMAALNWAAVLAHRRQFQEAMEILSQTDKCFRKKSLQDMLEVDSCRHFMDILDSIASEDISDLKYWPETRLFRLLSVCVRPFPAVLDFLSWIGSKLRLPFHSRIRKLSETLRQQFWVSGLLSKATFLEGYINLREMEGYQASKQVYRDVFLSYLDCWLSYGQDIKDFIVSSLKPRDAHALYCTIRQNKPSTVLEIGSFVGFSLCIMSQAVKDNGNGQIHSIDPNATFFSVKRPFDYAKKMLKKMNLDFVQSHEGFFSYPRHVYSEDIPVLGVKACDIIPSIDLAFIDGDHETTAVLQDFMLLLPHLSNESTVVFHDLRAWRTVRQAILIFLQDDIWNQKMKYFEFKPSGFDGLGILKIDKTEKIAVESGMFNYE